MIETYELNVAPQIIKVSWEAPYVVTGIDIDLKHNDDMHSYCCGDKLTTGYEIGVYSVDDDSPLEELFQPINVIANLIVWYLNRDSYRINVPEGAYFGIKILEDLSGIESHTISIEREN